MKLETEYLETRTKHYKKLETGYQLLVIYPCVCALRKN